MSQIDVFVCIATVFAVVACVSVLFVRKAISDLRREFNRAEENREYERSLATRRYWEHDTKIEVLAANAGKQFGTQPEKIVLVAK